MLIYFSLSYRCGDARQHHPRQHCLHVHRNNQRLIRSQRPFRPHNPLRRNPNPLIITQQHLLRLLNPIPRRIPLNRFIREIAQNKHLARSHKRKNLLALSINSLIIAVHKDIDVLLAQSQYRRPEVVRRVRIPDFALCIDSRVVRVHGHPGLDVGAGKPAVRGGAPLDGCAGVVARFLLVFLSGDLEGFGVEALFFV